MNPLLSDRALLKQRDLVASRYQKDRLPARGAAAQAAALAPSTVHLQGFPGADARSLIAPPHSGGSRYQHSVCACPIT
jgi:hypothetical protein